MTVAQVNNQWVLTVTIADAVEGIYSDLEVVVKSDFSTIHTFTFDLEVIDCTKSNTQADI